MKHVTLNEITFAYNYDNYNTNPHLKPHIETTFSNFDKGMSRLQQNTFNTWFKRYASISKRSFATMTQKIPPHPLLFVLIGVEAGGQGSAAPLIRKDLWHFQLHLGNFNSQNLSYTGKINDKPPSTPSIPYIYACLAQRSKVFALNKIQIYIDGDWEKCCKTWINSQKVQYSKLRTNTTLLHMSHWC